MLPLHNYGSMDRDPLDLVLCSLAVLNRWKLYREIMCLFEQAEFLLDQCGQRVRGSCSNVIFTFAPILICWCGCKAWWLGLMTPHSQGLQASHWGWERLARQPDQAHIPPQMCHKGLTAPGTQGKESERGGGPSSTRGCDLGLCHMLVL